MNVSNCVPSRCTLRPVLCLASLFYCLVCSGCAWSMLPATALSDPLGAVDGSGQVFALSERRPVDLEDVEQASDGELLAFYSPIIVQQYKTMSEKGFAYEHEVDLFGTPYLERLPNGQLQTRVDSDRPTIYGIVESRTLGQHEHTQLTYTLWYRRHPRTKTFDIEPGLVDSGVVRITLDERKRPMIYETALACGCYHKVFVEGRVEEACQQYFGPPVGKSEYSIAKPIPYRFDFEVAGRVDTPYDAPGPPVVFISSGEHRVLGLHSSTSFQWPSEPEAVVGYHLADYSELEAVPVANEGTTHSIFNSSNDQQVYGAERFERFIFRIIGTDDAGHPRRNDQILLHFDQSTWMDPNLFHKYLRLPPGLL
ncbi:MAG: hypothetical protein ACI8P0_001632 [Planctomycetaceae bacterium]|jgi:hypothetical protein